MKSLIAALFRLNFLVGIVAFYGVSHARSYSLEPEQLALGRADMVLAVSVVKAVENKPGGMCGSRYHALIKRVVKGDGGLREVDFGFVDGLEVGAAYKVFLSHASGKAGLYRFVRSLNPDEGVAREFVEGCSDVIPEYYLFRAERLK